MIPNEEDRKHNHYFIDVRGLDYIDPYMIGYLYGIDDPSGASQHALKKLLVSGKRGHKDELTDLTNVVDTTNRLIEMKHELAAREALIKPEEALTTKDVWVLKGTKQYFKTLEMNNDFIYLEALQGNREVFNITRASLNKFYTKTNARLAE